MLATADELRKGWAGADKQADGAAEDDQRQVQRLKGDGKAVEEKRQNFHRRSGPKVKVLQDGIL